MASDANVLDLVGQIYDAAGESSEWSAIGLPIARAVGAKYAWLMTTDPEHPAQCWNRSATGRDILDYPLNADPWYPAVTKREPGDVVLGSDSVSNESLRREPFYEQWLRPARIAYACMVIVERSEHNEHFFAFNRLPDAGDFTADDQRLLAVLAPHLQRAYALHTRLHSPFALPKRTDPALYGSPTGAFLLDRFDVVRWMNPAAERIVRASDGIGLVDGRLRLTDPAAAKQLRDDIERTRIRRGTGPAPSAVVRRCRRRSGELPYVFSVTPQNDSLSCLRFDCAATSCVLVDDLAVSRAPSTLSLKNVFGLTRAEAAVARALCGGETTSEIAERRSVSVHTVRTQVKALLAKTATRTQTELVGQLMKLVRVDQHAEPALDGAQSSTARC